MTEEQSQMLEENQDGDTSYANENTEVDDTLPKIFEPDYNIDKLILDVPAIILVTKLNFSKMKPTNKSLQSKHKPSIRILRDDLCKYLMVKLCGKKAPTMP